MKTVFAFLLFVACCMNVYAGCPNGMCHLKKSPVTQGTTYTVAPVVENSTTSVPATTKVNKTTKTRSYRVSKWR